MNIRRGDIFFWSYSDEEYEKRGNQRLAGTMYWAKDQYCVAVEEDGQIVLRDTYNLWIYNNPEEEVPFNEHTLYKGSVVCPGEVDLTFLGNVYDYEEVSDKWMLEDYHESDCLTVAYHHGCRKVFLRKKGANKCLVTIRRGLEKELAEALSDRSYLENKVKRLEKELEGLQ